MASHLQRHQDWACHHLHQARHVRISQICSSQKRLFSHSPVILRLVLTPRCFSMELLFPNVPRSRLWVSLSLTTCLGLITSTVSSAKPNDRSISYVVLLLSWTLFLASSSINLISAPKWSIVVLCGWVQILCFCASWKRSIQSKAVRIIGVKSVCVNLQSLGHRRSVAALCVMHRLVQKIAPHALHPLLTPVSTRMPLELVWNRLRARYPSPLAMIKCFFVAPLPTSGLICAIGVPVVSRCSQTCGTVYLPMSANSKSQLNSNAKSITLVMPDRWATLPSVSYRVQWYLTST